MAERQHSEPKSGRSAKLGLGQALEEATRRAVKEATRGQTTEASASTDGVVVVTEGAVTKGVVEGTWTIVEDTSHLLGGYKVIGWSVESELDAHEMLRRGLPRRALTHLVDKLQSIPVYAISEALGVSVRTLQRHKAAPGALLDAQQSGRAWKFAEILAKATRVLGSQEEAEQWLERPAIGLDQQRPVDLLTTPAGVKLVEDFLGRLEYGVYT